MHSGRFHCVVLRRDLLKGAAAMGAAAISGSLFASTVHSASPPSVVIRENLSNFQKSKSKLSALEQAIGEMQARSKRDPSDPSGWLVNAKAHADYCAVPRPNDPDQIHYCWWFLPWHRAYIAVTERKLRALANDPSIAFPYWNWSADRKIPASFTRAGSPLANARRATPRRAVQDGEVDFFPNDPAKAKLIVAALEAPAFEATTPFEIANSFGGIARPNSGGVYGNNRLEGVPHGPIHNYVGGDMADFETAGRDPIFFTHHGNLDRLWEIWRKDPNRKKTEPTSDAFKAHGFPFTWLDGSTIEVTVADTLDTKSLGYEYDSLDVLSSDLMGATMMATSDGQTLPPIASAQVTVPATLSQAGIQRQYSLVISGIEAPDRAMTVGVYVKPASDTSASPGAAAGAFAAILSGGHVQLPENELRFDVTEILKQAGTGELSVSLIPYLLSGDNASTYKPFHFREMRIVAGP